MCATEKENFSLGHQARRAFSQLARPVFGALLAGYFLKNILPGLVSWMSSSFLISTDDLPAVLLVLFIFLLALFGSLVSGFLELGALRLCLDWGEGREGAMPRTILSRWKTYRGWVLWTVVLNFVWLMGQRLIDTWVIYQFGHPQVDFYFDGKVYFNVAMTLLSLFVTMLLVLSAKTAYLRAPERGFWRAVTFGVREGLRKWPKTIKPQLKFVVPVSIGVSLGTVFLSRLAFRIGNAGISVIFTLAGRFLGLLAQTWTTVLYGQLAAVWYDPPDEEWE